MRRLLRAERLRITTQLEPRAHPLPGRRASAVTFDGGPAFRRAASGSVLRLQRRDAYRLKIPLGRPLMCDIPRAEGDAGRHARRCATSASPASASPTIQGPARGVGTVWPGCRINLPDLGPLVADIEVMHATEGERAAAAAAFAICRWRWRT
jgi:hypothetical protein